MDKRYNLSYDEISKAKNIEELHNAYFDMVATFEGEEDTESYKVLEDLYFKRFYEFKEK
jgi:hypothetical protein